MSHSIPVINMSTEDRKMVAYTCGHTEVLYDINNNTQMLLQGHVGIRFSHYKKYRNSYLQFLLLFLIIYI